MAVLAMAVLIACVIGYACCVCAHRADVWAGYE